MPRLVYVNPANFHQQYVTALASDPNVPSGYILTSGSDGAIDEAVQNFQTGINSGGFPAYTSDPTQFAVSPNRWINGILGGSIGDKL